MVSQSMVDGQPTSTAAFQELKPYVRQCDSIVDGQTQYKTVEGPVPNAMDYVSAYDPTYKLAIEPLHDMLNVVVDCGIKEEVVKDYLMAQDLTAVEDVKRSLDVAITAITTKQPTTLLGPAKACTEEIVNVGGTVEEEVKETVKVVIW